MIRQSWKYVAGATIGAMLGFGAFVLEAFAIPVYTDSCWPPRFVVIIPIRDSSDYWAFTSEDRAVAVLTKDGSEYEGGYHRPPKMSPGQKSEWQNLWLQLVFLDWLKSRGEHASLAAWFGAFLAVVLVRVRDVFHTLEYLRRNASA
jgi:hypothetical protein